MENKKLLRCNVLLVIISLERKGLLAFGGAKL